jgi:flavodoxin
MSFLKWSCLLVTATLALAALQVAVVTIVDHHQARKNAALLSRGVVDVSAGSRAAVVYYSRSGNTALMAQRIAQRLQARLYRVEAPDYQVGLLGWFHAMVDARKDEAVISPGAVDLSDYDSIYLGSPIWLYSPAPPIWQFVELNRFDNKHVVLFNTFNSQFKPEYIESFRVRVLERGARSFEHRYIRRGRMGQQLSTEQMLQAVDDLWPASSPR